MKRVTLKHNVALAGVALMGSYCLPYGVAYVQNTELLKITLLNQAVAATPKKDTTSDQIRLITANLLYETKIFKSPLKQKEAYRRIASSMVNKKSYEQKEDLSWVDFITERKQNPDRKWICQYSWYCQKGKTTNLEALKAEFKDQYPLALDIARKMVSGRFRPILGFDGAYYVTETVYINGTSRAETWLRTEIKEGRMCMRGLFDDHIHAAPKKGKTCDQNQLAFLD